MNAIALPRISINTDITAQQSPPFLGRITLDEIRPGKFVETAPYQWVIAVKPFKFAVKGNGFTEFIKIRPKQLAGEIGNTSQLGMHMAAFKKVFPDVQANIGEGEYVGKVAWFQRSEHVYPPNKNGEQFKTTLLIPVRAATDEELEEVGEAPVTPKAFALSEAQVEAILGALVGKKRSGFQKAAFLAKLEPSLIQAVVSGAAIDYLVERGIAYIDEDGALARSVE